MATKERRKTPPGAPKYHRLTEGKRIIIETLRKEGLSNRHIADRVGCSPATVGRELKRNLGKRGYRHKKAQAKANHRAAVKAAKRRKFTEGMWALAITATVSSGRSCPRAGRSTTSPRRRFAALLNRHAAKTAA